MTRWCSWHDGNTTDPVLIHVVEVGSGPSGSVYACQGCIEAHRLKPLLGELEDSGPRSTCPPPRPVPKAQSHTDG
jgi:hypothetical protein